MSCGDLGGEGGGREGGEEVAVLDACYLFICYYYLFIFEPLSKKKKKIHPFLFHFDLHPNSLLFVIVKAFTASVWKEVVIVKGCSSLPVRR